MEEEVDYSDELSRIEEISKNARATWISLLLATLFTLLSLSGVEDADFFSFGSTITLPIINVGAPTLAFYIVTPILLLALHLYLQIYIRKLWVFISQLPDCITLKSGVEVQLGHAIYPWVLSDVAIALRNSYRQNFFGIMLVFSLSLLLWTTVPAALSWFWLTAAAPHNFALTSFLAAVLAISIASSLLFFLDLVFLMRNIEQPRRVIFSATAFLVSTLALCLLLVASWNRTAGEVLGIKIAALYEADLRGATISERPDNWSTWAEAQRRYLSNFSGQTPQEIERQVAQDASWIATAREDFSSERRALLDGIRGPNLSGLDLRGANFSGAFLAGADLSNSDLRGAVFVGADLEGADLSGAMALVEDCEEYEIFGAVHTEKCTDFSRANLAFANFDGGTFSKSNFSAANLSFSSMNEAKFEDIFFSRATMTNVDETLGSSFSRSTFFLSDLSQSLLLGEYVEVEFSGSNLRRVSFVGEQTEEFDPDMANLQDARFFSSDLSEAQFPSVAELICRGSSLRDTSFYLEVSFDPDLFDLCDLSGSDLSNANLNQIDLDSSFGSDGTRLPDANPPLRLRTCIDFNGVARSSYEFRYSTFIPIVEKTLPHARACLENDTSSFVLGKALQ